MTTKIGDVEFRGMLAQIAGAVAVAVAGSLKKVRQYPPLILKDEDALDGLSRSVDTLQESIGLCKRLCEKPDSRDRFLKELFEAMDAMANTLRGALGATRLEVGAWRLRYGRTERANGD